MRPNPSSRDSKQVVPSGSDPTLGSGSTSNSNSNSNSNPTSTPNSTRSRRQPRNKSKNSSASTASTNNVDQIFQSLFTTFCSTLTEQELQSWERVFVQIEMMHWRLLDQSLVKNVEDFSSFRVFVMRLFRCVPALQPFFRTEGEEGVARLLRQYDLYLRSIPVNGCILLNATLTSFVIVRQNGEWLFPRGKIDKNESHLTCALREVREETGVAASAFVSEHEVLELKLNGKETRLYVVAGISDFVPLQPSPAVRHEIQDVRWFHLDSVEDVIRNVVRNSRNGIHFTTKWIIHVFVALEAWAVKKLRQIQQEDIFLSGEKENQSGGGKDSKDSKDSKDLKEKKDKKEKVKKTKEANSNAVSKEIAAVSPARVTSDGILIDGRTLTETYREHLPAFIQRLRRLIIYVRRSREVARYLSSGVRVNLQKTLEDLRRLTDSGDTYDAQYPYRNEEQLFHDYFEDLPEETTWSKDEFFPGYGGNSTSTSTLSGYSLMTSMGSTSPALHGMTGRNNSIGDGSLNMNTGASASASASAKAALASSDDFIQLLALRQQQSRLHQLKSNPLMAPKTETSIRDSEKHQSGSYDGEKLYSLGLTTEDYADEFDESFERTQYGGLFKRSGGNHNDDDDDDDGDDGDTDNDDDGVVIGTCSNHNRGRTLGHSVFSNQLTRSRSGSQSDTQNGKHGRRGGVNPSRTNSSKYSSHAYSQHEDSNILPMPADKYNISGAHLFDNSTSEDEISSHDNQNQSQSIAPEMSVLRAKNYVAEMYALNAASKHNVPISGLDVGRYSMPEGKDLGNLSNSDVVDHQQELEQLRLRRQAIQAREQAFMDATSGTSTTTTATATATSNSEDMDKMAAFILDLVDGDYNETITNIESKNEAHNTKQRVTTVSRADSMPLVQSTQKQQPTLPMHNTMIPSHLRMSATLPMDMNLLRKHAYVPNIPTTGSEFGSISTSASTSTTSCSSKMTKLQKVLQSAKSNTSAAHALSHTQHASHEIPLFHSPNQLHTPLPEPFLSGPISTPSPSPTHTLAKMKEAAQAALRANARLSSHGAATTTTATTTTSAMMSATTSTTVSDTHPEVLLMSKSDTNNRTEINSPSTTLNASSPSFVPTKQVVKKVVMKKVSRSKDDIPNLEELKNSGAVRVSDASAPAIKGKLVKIVRVKASSLHKGELPANVTPSRVLKSTKPLSAVANTITATATANCASSSETLPE